MTREEAKEYLFDIKTDAVYTISIDEKEAIDMAIKALEQNESAEEWYKLFVEKLEQASSGDLISLETVIEWLKAKDIIKLSSQEEIARKELKQLPSVNPQEPKYCDRNICIQNEYNDIGCDECEVTKSQEPQESEEV